MEEVATKDTRKGLTNKGPLDMAQPIRGCICRRLIEKFLVELIPSSILNLEMINSVFIQEKETFRKYSVRRIFLDLPHE